MVFLLSFLTLCDISHIILKYQTELNRMWETEQYIKLPPLT